MKTVYLVIISAIFLNLTNSKLEGNYYANKPATMQITTAKPRIPEKEEKPAAEKERNLSFKEVIQAVFNKFRNPFPKSSKTDDCDACCRCQKLTQASVFPLFKEIFRFFRNCETEKETCPCVPISHNELDYRTWVEELKNHKIKIYKSTKKCEEKISPPPIPQKRFEIPERKRSDNSISADCNDCSIVKSEDQKSLWLICKGCKVINPSSYKEFSKTGCIFNFVRIENKLVRIRTPYLQLNDFRTETKNEESDLSEFICPKVSLVGKKKKNCEK